MTVSSGFHAHGYSCPGKTTGRRGCNRSALAAAESRTRPEKAPAFLATAKPHTCGRGSRSMPECPCRPCTCERRVVCTYDIACSEACSGACTDRSMQRNATVRGAAAPPVVELDRAHGQLEPRPLVHQARDDLVHRPVRELVAGAWPWALQSSGQHSDILMTLTHMTLTAVTAR